MARAKVFNYEEMLKIRKEIVDFHGEMVLLENYSALNYTGTFHLYNFTLLLTLKFLILRGMWKNGIHF